MYGTDNVTAIHSSVFVYLTFFLLNQSVNYHFSQVQDFSEVVGAFFIRLINDNKENIQLSITYKNNRLDSKDK